VTVSAVLAALVLGALLNGTALVTAATGLDVGVTRTVAMRLATTVEATGTLLRLDGPHRWLSGLRDRGLQAPSVAEDTETTATQDVLAATPATDAPAREHDRDRRPISAEQPLEVLLIGDSLIGAVADGFGRSTGALEHVRWTKEVRISTGLARPDVLDWPRHLEQQLAAHDPDVVVLMLGGNDDQSLTGAPDGVIHLGQDGWGSEYERRVTELLAIAGRDDRLVVWLGLPAMRPDRLERTRPVLRAAAERAIAGTEVVLLDTEPAVSPDGYSSRLDGEQVRADDGVHLTHAGGDRVAALLDELLRARYDLPAS
jgi:hypothetical protein